MTGFYTASQNIARIPYFAMGALPVVLFPSISKSLSDKTHQRTANIIRDSLRYTLLLLLPVSFLLSATSKPIIQLLFSEKYVLSAPSLSILIFSFIFITIFALLANILNGAGFPKKSMTISFLGVILSAIFCYLLIPKYGLVGAAIATGISGFVTMMLAGFYVHKEFNALMPWQSLLKILFASSLIYLAARFIVLPTLLLPVVYGTCALLYIGILILLRELTKYDFDIALSLLPNSLRSLFNK